MAASVAIVTIVLTWATAPLASGATRPGRATVSPAVAGPTDSRTGGFPTPVNGASGASERWRRPLREIPLQDTRDTGQYPPDLAQELDTTAIQPTPGGQVPRWSGTVFQWAASELDHQPLYFDDVPLERYGQSMCPLLQPFCSGARFYGSLPVMPYKVALDPPWECVSTLGPHRVGTCAPCTHQALPLDRKGAFLEGGAWVGFIFLLP